MSKPPLAKMLCIITSQLLLRFRFICYNTYLARGGFKRLLKATTSNTLFREISVARATDAESLHKLSNSEMDCFHTSSNISLCFNLCTLQPKLTLNLFLKNLNCTCGRI